MCQKALLELLWKTITMLKQRLTQKLQQRLSPQQIQLMKLLQVPTASLEQRVKEELEVNPALEEGKVEAEKDEFDNKEEPEKKEDPNDDIDLSEYISDDDGIADYKLKTNNYRDPDDNKTIPIPVVETFHDHLKNQLGLLQLNDREVVIAKQLIGSIDDDGYLRRELEAIIDDLAFTQYINSDMEELSRILDKLHTFEPAGVGARNPQECLLIQINRKLKLQPENTSLINAKRLLKTHFEEFAKKHYTKLLRQLSITEDELKDANDEILKLNPKPGSGHASESRAENYVIPDFILVNDNGELNLSLNSRNAPDLKVSNDYVDMMRAYNKSKTKDKKEKEAILFIKQKIDSAKWFIDAIKQRQQTMMNCMQAILEYQYAYFLTGDETRLKPMILKDIAEITGLDISTISRVAHSKYIQTEFGTFQLKSFFSESIQKDNGEEVSTREVKKILKDMIADEDKRKPLSDQKLTDTLVGKGYNIARRTVAKYREQLNIPVARLRKVL